MFAACVLLLAAAAGGEVLLHETFDYPNGPLVTVSAGRWITHNGAVTGQVEVLNGQVNLTQEETEDVSVSLAGGPYPAGGTAHVFYASFRVRFTALPGETGAFFAHFKDAGTGYRARVWAFTGGAAPGYFRLGISSASASALSATNPVDLALHTDYQVVCRLANTTSVCTLWLDPDTESDPSVSTAEPASACAVAAFALRQAPGLGGLTIDDLRVGPTFADVVPPLPPGPTPTLSVLTYNVGGNGALDWSTNSLQVQALGRQLRCLQPDLIAFNEIPAPHTWQMTNFVAAYLPGYFLATNSGTDGFLRSVIASRFPIARSASWLDGASLAPFGYTNAYPHFTRDLFEAEVRVPGFLRPLHVFTAHLKAGRDAIDLARRAAEASAVSNFLTTTFLPAKGRRPYVLLGDLNEDVLRPPAGSLRPVERLANGATGLQLLTPLNPVTGDDRTLSIRSSLFARFDYVLPCGLLAAHLEASEVFRTDLLQPLPPGLWTDDSRTASDHLPVLAVFRNPFAAPFRVTALEVRDRVAHLSWPSLPGQSFCVEGSRDLLEWTVLSPLLVATGSHLSWSTNASTGHGFYRVRRGP